MSRSRILRRAPRLKTNILSYLLPAPSQTELVAHSPTPSRQSTAALSNGLG